MSTFNCMVAQSGGPTVAINSSLAGVISGAMGCDLYDRVYGSVNGILGILEDRITDLTALIEQNPDNLECLKHTPAMYLGSCRYKLPDYAGPNAGDERFGTARECYSFIFRQFEKYNIGAFFYIGGNDSMDTVLKLSEYAASIGSNVRIIGIPKTIDNDLMLTDHTPGFGSAAKYIATSLLEIAHDTYIYAVKSVTIVEIMGRDAGWLTAASCLARNSYNSAPHLIYLPERNFNEDEFIEDVRNLLSERNNVIVAVSEGIHDAEGNYISATEAAADKFGHSQLSGAGKALEYMVKERIGVKVRSVEVNVLQRCAAHLASLTDINEAFASGEYGVQCAAEGITGAMITINRREEGYAVDYGYAQIKGIANEARCVPAEWINERGNDVKQPMYDYLLPLIQGEVLLQYSNGLPVYMDVEHLI
ncbi:MAG: 6-phosphofructokinase [Butyrivibrio sp.]